MTDALKLAFEEADKHGVQPISPSVDTETFSFEDSFAHIKTYYLLTEEKYQELMLLAYADKE